MEDTGGFLTRVNGSRGQTSELQSLNTQSGLQNPYNPHEC